MDGRAQRALVLSGGGLAGGAWLLGLLEGLRAGGVHLGEADLIVGTSAGARIGAVLATGSLERVHELYRRMQLPPIAVPAPLEAFVTATMTIASETPDRQEAARRIANLEPLGATLVSESERDRFLAVHVPPGAEWPERRMLVTSVDGDTGQRAVFDAGAGVGLSQALAASGALPGLFPLPTIGGHRYADGGVHSLYNADLAVGHDIVAVLSPLPLNDVRQAQLAEELTALGDAAVQLVIANDASLAAIGRDPMSIETVPAVLAAGAAQAEETLDALASIWKKGS